MEDIYDLEAAIITLAGTFKEIETIYLFGSRRFDTKSSRSDVDILLVISESVKPAKLREFILNHSTALDLFILDNGKATSVANESYIEAENNTDLIKTLNAVMLFDRSSGKTAELSKRKQIEIDKRVKHELTSLPNGRADAYEVRALQKFFKAARENGLSAKPYIGTSTDEASDFIIFILRNLISSNATITNHGQAKDGWTNNLKSEYDFQNLFWITVKPWLPGLSREQTAIVYDDQKKNSDFSIFNDQLVLELKHIKDSGDKRETVKTLEGLKKFYTQHPNIRTLIFAILVDKEVELDDKKWEVDFSYLSNQPSVKTVIIRNS